MAIRRGRTENGLCGASGAAECRCTDPVGTKKAAPRAPVQQPTMRKCTRALPKVTCVAECHIVLLPTSLWVKRGPKGPIQAIFSYQMSLCWELAGYSICKAKYCILNGTSVAQSLCNSIYAL